MGRVIQDILGSNNQRMCHYLMLIACTLTCSHCLHAQKIEQYIAPNGYRYGHEFMHFDDMASVFALDAKALKYYKTYKDQKKSAQVLGISSLVLFGSGLIGIGINKIRSNSRPNYYPEEILTPVIMLVLSPLPFLASVGLKVSSSTSKNKAIDIFNTGKAIDFGCSQKRIDFRLSISASGLGIIMNF